MTAEELSRFIAAALNAPYFVGADAPVGRLAEQARLRAEVREVVAGGGSLGSLSGRARVTLRAAAATLRHGHTPRAPESRLSESEDAQGHEHRGKGPGGGQFTSGGGGSRGAAWRVSTDNRIHGREVATLERPRGGVFDAPAFRAAERVALETLGRAGAVTPVYHVKHGVEHGAVSLYVGDRERVLVYREGGKVYVDRGTVNGKARLELSPDDPPEKAAEKVRRVAGLRRRPTQESRLSESEDASGHQHKGAGPGGGQFTSGGGGGGAAGGEKEKPKQSKRSARREREQAEAQAAFEKAHEEWEARGEARQGRRDDIDALMENSSPQADKLAKRAEELDLQDQAGEALLKTSEGRKEYAERAAEYARVRVALWDAAYDEGLAGELRGAGFPENTAGKVEELRLKGKAATEKAAAKYTQAVKKRLAHQEKRPGQADEAAEELWLEKDAALEGRVDDAYGDLTDDALDDRISDAISTAGEKLKAQIDREDEKDEEPEGAELSGPGHDEHEKEVGDWIDRSGRALDMVETTDEPDEDEDESPQQTALDDLIGRVEDIDDLQKTSPDEAEGKLRDYLKAAAAATTLYRTNGNPQGAAQIRATAAHALRALKALEDDE